MDEYDFDCEVILPNIKKACDQSLAPTERTEAVKYLKEFCSSTDCRKRYLCSNQFKIFDEIVLVVTSTAVEDTRTDYYVEWVKLGWWLSWEKSNMERFVVIPGFFDKLLCVASFANTDAVDNMDDELLKATLGLLNAMVENDVDTSSDILDLYFASTLFVFCKQVLLTNKSSKVLVYPVKMMCSLVAGNLDKKHTKAILDSGIHILLLEILRVSGEASSWDFVERSDGTAWSYRSWIVVFFSYFCRFADVSTAIIAAKGAEVLILYVSTPTIVSKFLHLYAMIAVSFLCGDNERDSSKNQQFSILEQHNSIMDSIVQVILNITAEDVMPYLSRFPLAIGLDAVLSCARSDSNKAVMVKNKVLLPTILSILERFANNDTEYLCRGPTGKTCRPGGGGKDVEVASKGILLLACISYYTEDDEILRSEYMIESLKIPHLLKRLLENRLLKQSDKDNITNLLSRLDPSGPFKSIVVEKADLQQTKRPQHIMISYNWTVGKDRVVALTALLKAQGYEVWRDEEGSALVSKMEGDVQQKMAEAIEASSHVIVCISKPYKQSPNCHLEKSYIVQRQRVQVRNLRI